MNQLLRIVICDDEQTAISIISASVEALLTSRSVAVDIQKFTSAQQCGSPRNLGVMLAKSLMQ